MATESELPVCSAYEDLQHSMATESEMPLCSAYEDLQHSTQGRTDHLLGNIIHIQFMIHNGRMGPQYLFGITAICSTPYLEE